MLGVPVDVGICGPAAPFEVIVLATVHAPWQFRSPRFTPAHVRAALALANPDVVGVESPPEWFQKGRFHEVTYEAQGIAVPFARARKIPVVGIDWQDLPAREQREADEEAQRSAQLTASLSGGGVLPLGAYGRLPATAIPSTLSFFRDPQFDFDLVNDVGADGHAKPALGGEDPAAPGFGGRRNREIAGRAIRAMEGCGGKRLVLVIGAGHKTVLDALLSRIPGVRVLRWGKDVPAPTPEDVDRAWTSEDLLAVLGHNLDGERSYFHPELIDFPRMHAILARLAKAGGNEEAAAYFQARLLTAEATLVKAPAEDGRFQDARRILSTLAESPAGKKKDSAILYPFPMDHWRMRYALEQAVRLERARLNLSAADAREQAAARKDLQALVVERRAAEKPLARREDALKDPGFEGDGLAVGPVFGWYCDDARPGGRVRAAPDESVKAEGRRALRLDVLPGEGLGFVSVSQCIAIPDERAGKPWDFSLRLRGERVTSVTLVAYRLEDGGRRAVEIARGPSVGVGSSWAGANLTIALPKDVSLLMVACVLVAPPGARLWLDDASPLQTTVTRPTVPDLLAREFGRTLLAPPP